MDALQLLGSLLGNNATASRQGSQILGQLIGGLTRSGAQGGGTGGLNDILGRLTGGGAQTGGTGGLADILGGLMGGGAQGGRTGGGLTDLLSGLTGRAGSQGGMTPGGSGSGLLGSLVMVALQMFGQSAAAGGQSPLSGLAGMLAPGQASPAAADVAQAQQGALTFIKAMINAAKADGQIDAGEQQKIVARLGNVGPEEAAFVREEMAKPLNFDFFADITTDMVPQVYAVSLMAINVDTAAEVQYLQQLAQGLGLDPQTINGIHAQLGLAPLYA
jgi:uncharacterized membrane protein YebE (DUF533 family)